MHLGDRVHWENNRSMTMHAKDRGLIFCISPDRKEGRWIHPADYQHFYSNWTDVTEWPDGKLVAFLEPEPEQQDLFAA